jgi:hypothetical protein
MLSETAKAEEDAPEDNGADAIPPEESSSGEEADEENNVQPLPEWLSDGMLIEVLGEEEG